MLYLTSRYPVTGGLDFPRAAGRREEGGLVFEGEEDETARVLAEHGPPERWLEYALMEAARLRREAVAAARWDAAGVPDEEALRAADAVWVGRVAEVTGEYALAVGAGAPGEDAPTAEAAAYARGLEDGSALRGRVITARTGDGGEWRALVAGYAAGAREAAARLAPGAPVSPPPGRGTTQRLAAAAAGQVRRSQPSR